MALRLTGKAGGATVGTTAWVIDGWEYEEMSESADAPAAGDVATHRAHVRADWRATVRSFLADSTPYAIPSHEGTTRLTGSTNVAVVLKMKSTDAGTAVSITAGVGVVRRALLTHTAGQATRGEFEIVASAGDTVPTVDLSPST